MESIPISTIGAAPLQAGAAEPASPGRRRSGPLGGQEATRSERPWGPHYRGRFAPSPTGALHAGSLVAALASWLDARAQGGRWLVRIEDVDGPRCVPGADQIILGQLAACGLVPDEPQVHQSLRGSLYQNALNTLIAGGHAYPCACSRQDVLRVLQAAGTLPPRHGELVYPGTCRDGLHGRTPRAWRFNTGKFKPNRPSAQSNHAQAAINSVAETADAADDVVWQDRRLGRQTQHVGHAIGDFILKRADGLWAYQLAVVVDDAAQGVSDIVRGEDLADNTARQILLQQALGLPTPNYLHTPLVLGVNGEKLSKQNGAVALDLYRPVSALQQAGAVLGLPGHSQAATTGEWLQRAVPQWLELRFHPPGTKIDR